jgi:protein gp37
MATDTSIEWADKTWSPIIGCDRVSPGCDSCYAIGTARIREANPHPRIAAAFAGTTQRTDAGVDWSGTVNLLNDRLAEPLGWKKPVKVFVNSLSDLFHKNVPDDFIAKVFAVMALTPQHTYQLLTKRHARMRNLLNDRHFAVAVRTEMYTRDRHATLRQDEAWPLPNLWLGVSVENQHWANIRVPALLDTPAAVRWISAEPLLGPVDLYGDLRSGVYRCPCGAWERDSHVHTLCPDCGKPWRHKPGDARIDWVVAGGESGPKARPMHPDWARSLRKQCTTANVPFLFKQWGTWGVDWPLDNDGKVITTPRGQGITVANDGTIYQPGDLSYPDGPRYGEALRADHGRANLTAMYRLGKKKAGRELDGRTHDEFPVAG